MSAANPMLACVAERQAVIARMGARAAFLHFVAETERDGSPSWSHQERAALRVLTEKDFAAWDRHWPAPGGAP